MIAAALALAALGQQAAAPATAPAGGAQQQQAGHIASHVVVRGTVRAWALSDQDGDGDTDLVLATVSEDGRRVLCVYHQEQRVVFSAEPAEEIAVPRAVVCWSVGDFLDAPGEELLFLARDGAYVRGADGRLQRLHEAPMLLDMPASDQLPYWRSVADVDGDGRTEVALVTAQGFRVIGADGALRAEVALRPQVARMPAAARAFLGGAVRAKLSSEELSDLLVPNEEAGVLEPPPALYSEVSLPRPEFVDADGDGRLDLSWVEDGVVHLRFQDADGGFPEEGALRLELPSSDAYDNGYLGWRQVGGGAAADLLLTRTDRSTISFSSDWQALVWVDPVRAGALGDPDALLKTEAGYLRVHVGDWDGDGRVDLATSAWSVDAGLLAADRATVSHSLALHLAGPKGWTARPALVHKRDYALDDVSAFRELDAMIHDATGDGRPDLLESDESGVLEVRPLLAGGGAALRLPDKPAFRISVDALAAAVEVADLNGDGISDFLVSKEGYWQMHLSYRP